MRALVDVLPMLGLEVEEAEGCDTHPLIMWWWEKCWINNPILKHCLSVCQVNVGGNSLPILSVGQLILRWVTACRLPYPERNCLVDLNQEIKLRGVPSEGMMCSQRMVTGDDDRRLMILADSPSIGN